MSDNEKNAAIITPEPISKESFALFGDVIDCAGSHDFLINDGDCERYNDRARLDIDSSGKPGVSLFKSRCYSLPYTLRMMERHPLASQTFIPMSSDRILVVVAHNNNNNNNDRPGTPRAFLTQPEQAINLLRGVWHGVLTPLGTSGLFAVVDYIGGEPNCDVHKLKFPFTIQARL
jgi:ureidoglycolate lyase